MSDPTPQQLVSFIREHFDLSEVIELSFQLGIDPDELGGETKGTKVQKLASKLNGRGRFSELLVEVYRLRPELYLAKFGSAPQTYGVVSAAPASPDGAGARNVPVWVWVVSVVFVIAVVWAYMTVVRQSNENGLDNWTPNATQINANSDGAIVRPSVTPMLTAQPLSTATSSTVPKFVPSSTVTVLPTSTPSYTPTVAATATPQAGDVRTVLRGGIEVEQVYVSAGEFIMGASDGTDLLLSYEPQRVVYLDAFWIDRTEVTNQQHFACQSEDACARPGRPSSFSRPSYYYQFNLAFADFPVIYVDWNLARHYCSWADARLPTEAEWEKAARGNDGRQYSWGDETVNCQLANTGLLACNSDTTAVGSYPSGASPYGALDMMGNVWEWVNDWYDSDYYRDGPAINPLGPDSGMEKIIRGGSWFRSNYYSRTFTRLSFPIDFASHDIGFRCASN